MWGTSFADFARKAQEQASSLTEQANSLTSPVGAVSLFNLDSMQSSTDVDNSTTTTTPTATTTTPTASSLFSALSGEPAPAPVKEETISEKEELPAPPPPEIEEEEEVVAVSQPKVTKLDADTDDGADEWDWDESGDHTNEAPVETAWNDGVTNRTDPEGSAKSTEVLAEPAASFQLGSVAALAVSAMGGVPVASEPPAAQTPSEMLLAAAIADAANDDDHPTAASTTSTANQSGTLPTSSFRFDTLPTTDADATDLSNPTDQPRELEVTDMRGLDVQDKELVQHEDALVETPTEDHADEALFGDEGGDGWNGEDDDLLDVDKVDETPQEKAGQLDGGVDQPVDAKGVDLLHEEEEVNLSPEEEEVNLSPEEEEVGLPPEEEVLLPEEEDLLPEEEEEDLLPEEEEVDLIAGVELQPPRDHQLADDRIPVETDGGDIGSDMIPAEEGVMLDVPSPEAFEIGDDDDEVGLEGDDGNAGEKTGDMGIEDDDIMDMYDDDDEVADLPELDEAASQGHREEYVAEVEEETQEVVDVVSKKEESVEGGSLQDLSSDYVERTTADAAVSVDHEVEDGVAVGQIRSGDSARVDEVTHDNKVDEVAKDIEVAEPFEVDSPPPASDRGAGSEALDAAEQAVEAPHVDRPESLPQHTIEKFMEQLQRIDAEHQSEMEGLQNQYQAEMEALRAENERLAASAIAAASSNRANSVASHDKCLAQMRALESDFNKQLREKDEETKDMVKEKERLARESVELKNEIKRLTDRVSSGEEIVSKLTEQHGRGIEGMDKKLASTQADLREKNAEINKLQDALSTAKSDLDSANSAYDDLKDRVKGVATELKERRQECRELKASVDELTVAKTMFETQVSNLQSQLTQYERSVLEKDEELESVRSKASAAAAEIESLTKALKEQSAVGEKALSSYKKKAQTSLATANSRAAAANQAREEAEADANAARTTAEQAVERARVAENEKKQAVEEAQKDAVSLRAQLEAESAGSSKLKDDNEDLREELLASKAEVDDLKSERTVLLKEMEVSKQNLDREREKNALLAQEVSQEKRKSNAFAKEAEEAKEEVERTASAAFMSRQREAHSALEDDKFPNAASVADFNTSVGSDLGADEAEGTILMLQHELAGANEAIEELKDALRNALEKSGTMNGSAGHGDGLDRASVSALGGGAADGTVPDVEDGGGNDFGDTKSTPLLFALQKQSELDTAHNEINRLANLLGDAEAEKRDAYDAMDDMRRRMEEAEARLRRMEKLGPGVSTSNANAPAYGGSTADRYKIGAMGVGGGQSMGVGNPPQPVTAEEDPNRSVVNLEYLKNVMLSYFNAKTMKERRSLVPAVAAVLELTPDELDMALQSVEESAGIQGVTSSLWESLESTAQSLM